MFAPNKLFGRQSILYQLLSFLLFSLKEFKKTKTVKRSEGQEKRELYRDKTYVSC